MAQEINTKTLDKVTKGFLSIQAVQHKRPKEPTKGELNKKFVMRISSKGKVEMKTAI